MPAGLMTTGAHNVKGRQRQPMAKTTAVISEPNMTCNGITPQHTFP